MYDAERHNTQQRYQRTYMKFGWLNATLSFLVTLVFFVSGGFGWLDEVVRQWSSSDVVRTLLYFGLLYFALEVVSIPLSAYATFVIEARYGFNKTSAGTFVLDRLKGWLLTIVVGGGVLSLVVLIYAWTQQWFWLVAWGVMTAISLFMSTFYSQLIVPLFNRQTPLEAGPLRDAIEAFAQRVGFSLSDIYVIDSSRRSTKANAYFTGLGRRKRIVIYDTLIEQLTPDEIVAVLAHEVGHYKRHHTRKSLALQLPLNLLMFFLLGLMLGSDTVALAAGSSEASFYVNMVMFSFLYTPLSTCLDIVGNVVSRRHEYEADRFARDNGVGEPLISGLKKISGNALGNPSPHPVRVFVEYSHPTLAQRIRALRAT